MDSTRRHPGAVQRLLHVLRLHRWLLLISALYFLTAWLTALTLRLEFRTVGRLHGMLTSGTALACWAIGGYAIYVLWIVRPPHPTSHIIRGIQNFFTLERVAGGLLIAPGFISDVLGLVLLIPGIRAMIHRTLSKRVSARVTVFAGGQAIRRGRSTPVALPDEIIDIEPD